MIPLRWLFVTLSVGLSLALPAQVATQGSESSGMKRIEISVEGVSREALVYTPASAKTVATPLVFIFHGHGGTMRNAARSFDLQKHWPEAIIVYPQGLKTPGQLTDPQGNRSGWQAQAGDQNDRDLKFFDELFAKLKTDYHVDSKRIYATGHSNGGGFTYLLWAKRGDALAAVAPSSAAARFANTLIPKPAFIVGGENDPLVKFSWQQATIDTVRQINGCESEGKPWNKLGTIYPSKSGTPLVTMIHPGGHEFDHQAPPLIVKFFKEHPTTESH